MVVLAAPDKPLHVVVIAPPATYATQWCEYFRARGWRVDRISYAFDHAEALETIPELRRRLPPLTVVAALREALRLRRLLRRLDPDIVHAHWLAGPAWLAALSGRRPFLATAWGSDALVFTAPSLLARLMVRLVGLRAAAVTHDSESVGDALAGFGIPRARLRRIVFGADGAIFRPLPGDPELLRSLGVDNDDPTLVSPRGLAPVYEPETVIRGFAAACRLRPCNLLIRVDNIHIDASATNADAREQWEELVALAEELGVADRIFPYTGVDRADLPRLLSSVAAVISVPNSDGTSVVLLESLFVEAPVIVSDLPANREWIVDDGFGWIVPPGDAEALAEAIVGVLSDRGDARAAAGRAAGLAHAHGDGAKEMARAHDLYLEIVGDDRK
jgi:L-malate glycosyltransferase